ncbi:MAG TPA: hypothetical protein DIW31_03945 [Bacteroidales bacterium]|nr:hypothetical protein [Bacteroidales bacterium]
MRTASISVKSLLPSVLFDIVAVTVIFLLPSFSHLTGIAMYQLDPMRLALFAAILLTNRKNAFVIAFLLPIVSFIISSHPYFYKVFLISTELIINVWLFYLFANRIKSLFFASFLSIVISKAIYYLLKFVFIQFLLINDSLVSTSLVIQLVVSVGISILVAFAMKKKLE